MFTNRKLQIKSLWIVIVIGVSLVGCRSGDEIKPASTDTPPGLQSDTSATPTLIPATSTPEPLAAVVNGEQILLMDFEEELFRYKSAINGNGGVESEMATGDIDSIVIEDMINQILLAQAAQENGFSISEQELNARLEDLANQMGGEDNINNWLSENHYSDISIRKSMARSLAASWQREKITSSVPESAEQVHARQVMFYDEITANRVFQQLENGANFEIVAFQYDTITGGYLGWFPTGYILVPELEEAAFSLEPGQYSPVIQSQYGFHIIFLMERTPDRVFSPDVRKTLQHRALDQWIGERRDQSSIEMMLVLDT